MVIEMLQRKDIQQMEKLKLAIIYALRYETEERKIEKIKDFLRDSKIDQVIFNFLKLNFYFLTNTLQKIQNKTHFFLLEYD
jgi:hypothetical protein